MMTDRHQSDDYSTAPAVACLEGQRVGKATRMCIATVTPEFDRLWAADAPRMRQQGFLDITSTRHFTERKVIWIDPAYVPAWVASTLSAQRGQR